jgi:1-acyl-sn-glycerol-3-phosphate acyltransferase
MDQVVLGGFLPGSLFTWPAQFAQVLCWAFSAPGHLFVRRFDPARALPCGGAATADRANIVFFPEGAFTRRAGLSEFYLGAFKVAAEAGLPVVPGTIRGTRSILRSDQWFPRWTPLSVTIGNAIMPAGKDFAAVLRLRDEARKVVLAGCGEPDLGELVKPPHPLRGTFASFESTR